MERDARISIVLATYNERENIVDTIQSIFDHVKDPVEVIVVDDDSADETWQLVENLQDPRIVVIRRVDTRGFGIGVQSGHHRIAR